MDLTELLDWMAVRGAQLSIDRDDEGRRFHIHLHSRHRGKLCRVERMEWIKNVHADPQLLSIHVGLRVLQLEKYEKDQDACSQEATTAEIAYRPSAITQPAKRYPGGCTRTYYGSDPNFVV